MLDANVLVDKLCAAEQLVAQRAAVPRVVERVREPAQHALGLGVGVLAAQRGDFGGAQRVGEQRRHASVELRRPSAGG